MLPARPLPFLLLVTLLAASVGALAQETGQSSFTLVSGQDGAAYVWYLEGRTDKNPTLVVPSSSEITIVAKKGDDPADIPHNIQVGGAPVSDMFTAPGESVTYTFTSLPSGTQTYVCTIHPTTMLGTVRVAGTPEEGGDDTPAPGVLAAVGILGVLALLVRRR